VVKKLMDESILNIDHERQQNAVILVDEWGYYLGDWRNFDVEGVRQVMGLLNQCLRWFEHTLHLRLVALFAQEKVMQEAYRTFVRSVFLIKLQECAPAQKFSSKQKRQIEAYLMRVLQVPEGLSCTLKNSL